MSLTGIHSFVAICNSIFFWTATAQSSLQCSVLTSDFKANPHQRPGLPTYRLFFFLSLSRSQAKLLTTVDLRIWGKTKIEFHKVFFIYIFNFYLSIYLSI